MFSVWPPIARPRRVLRNTHGAMGFPCQRVDDGTCSREPGGRHRLHEGFGHLVAPHMTPMDLTWPQGPASTVAYPGRINTTRR